MIISLIKIQPFDKNCPFQNQNIQISNTSTSGPWSCSLLLAHHLQRYNFNYFDKFNKERLQKWSCLVSSLPLRTRGLPWTQNKTLVSIYSKHAMLLVNDQKFMGHEPKSISGHRSWRHIFSSIRSLALLSNCF